MGYEPHVLCTMLNTALPQDMSLKGLLRQTPLPLHGYMTVPMLDAVESVRGSLSGGVGTFAGGPPDGSWATLPCPLSGC